MFQSAPAGFQPDEDDVRSDLDAGESGARLLRSDLGLVRLEPRRGGPKHEGVGLDPRLVSSNALLVGLVPDLAGLEVVVFESDAFVSAADADLLRSAPDPGAPNPCLLGPKTVGVRPKNVGVESDEAGFAFATPGSASNVVGFRSAEVGIASTA